MTGSGRIQLHDPESRKYAFPRAKAYGLSVQHRFSAPNVDQFYLSGCVGFAGTNMLNCGDALKSRRAWNRFYSKPNGSGYLTNNDGLENYAQATRLDPFDWEYPPTDEGSSALGLMKYWKKIGVISEYRWAFGFDQFLAALEYQPVLVGTNWYEGMSELVGDGLAILRGDNVGGHEYLATGINRQRKRIRFENSWGENWGHAGAFYMAFSDVSRLLSEGGDVAVPMFL